MYYSGDFPESTKILRIPLPHELPLVSFVVCVSLSHGPPASRGRNSHDREIVLVAVLCMSNTPLVPSQTPSHGRGWTRSPKSLIIIRTLVSTWYDQRRGLSPSEAGSDLCSCAVSPLLLQETQVSPLGAPRSRCDTLGPGVFRSSLVRGSGVPTP